MMIDTIKQVLADFPELQHLEVEGDGQHFQITIISTVFQEQSKLARQRMVYQYLNPLIIDGRLHAVELQTLTPAEQECI